MIASSLLKFTKDIEQLIYAGDVGLALDQLQNLLRGSAPDLYRKVIRLGGQYNRNRRELLEGRLTQQYADVQYARIEAALIDLLEQIPRHLGPDASPVSNIPAATLDAPLLDDVKFEKIIGISNLKQISWLAQGLQMAKSVCRILTPDGVGTGFLISRSLLMTNNHVVPSQTIAEQSEAEFNYQQNTEGKIDSTYRYKLDVSMFHTSPQDKLDYTIVRIHWSEGLPGPESWGCVLLNADADPGLSEHVTIIQHPNGGLKQIALTANQVVNVWEHRLHYTTDTMPGSSGSPVFNDRWQAVAIHHAGGSLQTNARGDRRFINEGILMSAIRSDAGESWPTD